MPLHLALLTSLALHVLLIIGPIWLAAQPPPPPAPAIAARLLPVPAPEAIAEAVSTTASPADARPQQPAVPPRRLQGAALQRAQAALSKHLFYPPPSPAVRATPSSTRPRSTPRATSAPCPATRARRCFP